MIVTKLDSIVSPSVFFTIVETFLILQSRSKTAVLVDQVDKQKSKYKKISQDQSSRIVQLEETLQKKCSTIAKLSSNLEMVQAALRLAEGRVRELSMTARSRESVLSSLREEWSLQEKKMRSEHQVSMEIRSFVKLIIQISGAYTRFTRRNRGAPDVK